MSARSDDRGSAAGAPGRLQLSAARRRILSAAVCRLLPSDDGPGAAETGVADYVEGALADPWHRHFGPLFERGLDLFQGLASNLKGKDFVLCSPEEQDEVLLAAQEFPNNDARRFFEGLIHLALEGFLCDPAHGGNRGKLGWRHLGFDPGDPEACAGEGGL